MPATDIIEQATVNTDRVSNSYSDNNNEVEGINLRWIIHALLDAKAAIIVSCIAFSALALITFFALPLKSKANVELLEVPSTVSEKYKALNVANIQLNLFNLEVEYVYNQYGFAKKTPPDDVDNDTPTSTFFSITGDKLIDQLADKLLTRTNFIESINKHQLIQRSDYESDEEYQNAVIKNAYEIQILPPNLVDGVTPQRQSNIIRNWTIMHAAYDAETLRNTIFDALELATQEVKQDLINKFNQAVSLEKKNRQFLVENIDQFIKLRINEYDREMKSRIVILKEQAELARVLGIAKNALEVRSLSSDNQILAIQQTQNKEELFFRGYEALEREITQIKTREDNIAFVSDISPLETLKLRILQDTTLKRLEDAFASSPIYNNVFKAANYQKFGVKIIPPSTRFIIPIIIFIFGLLGTIILILMRRFLKN